MSSPTGSSQWFANPGDNFYNGVISQSLRLSVGSDYKLDRQMITPTSVTGTIFTCSWWMKKSAHGTVQSFIQCRDEQASGNYGAYWSYSITQNGTGDEFAFHDNSADGAVRVGAANGTFPYKDTSAWYHTVLRVDTTQSTAANRVRIYINGTDQVDNYQSGSPFAYPDQNYVMPFFNNDGEHLILFGNGEDNGDSFDGYIAEFNWVDGLSLAPESFGELKEGVWIPVEYSGSYGLNGCRYTFSDSSDIGKDSSGVGNDLDRVANIAATDVVLDSPENNFSTLQPLYRVYSGSETFAEGNLKRTHASSGVTTSGFSNMGIYESWGLKWYAEVRVNATSGGRWIGVIREILKASRGLYGAGVRSNGYAYKAADGNKTTTDNNGASYGNSYGAGDVIGILLDTENNTISFSKNGTVQNSGTAAFTSITATSAYGNGWFIFGCDADPGNNETWNFGQDSSFAGEETATSNTDANGFGTFHTAPPTGYLAVCTANFPEPVIGPNSTDGNCTDHFNTVIWTGESVDGTTRAINVGFKPDFIWGEPRNRAADHMLLNSNVGFDVYLRTNGNQAEGAFDSFNNDAVTDTGYVLDDDEDGYFNYAPDGGTADNMVAWHWKANGGTATATISESGNNPAAVVQANPAAGFSIITYTGTGAAGTIAHGLGAVPQTIWIKNRDAADNWAVYHAFNTAAPATEYLIFNTTAATADSAAWWNDTAPTSSVFTVNSDHAVNADGEKYVAYVFAQVDGFSSMGNYIGNANDDGPLLYTGFKPAWLLIKSCVHTESWHIWDNKRDLLLNPNQAILSPNTTGNDTGNSTPYNIDFLSNGFKIREDHDLNNGNNDNHIWVAFAERPFKYGTGSVGEN
mgnify:CR=1 FL=1